jgi:hypothetical protein
VRSYNLSNLTDALSRHYHGEVRVLLLFRHVDMADGPVVLHTVANLARKAGTLAVAPHCFFLYGWDVLNWAGCLARWIFPRAGGIAVANSQQDRVSIDAIRAVLKTSNHPLAFAPEGQVTYRMNTVGPTTRGVGTFAWWFRQQGPGESTPPVVVVPIGLGYLYPGAEERVLLDTLREIATATATTAPEPNAKPERRVAWLIRQTVRLFGIIADELIGDASTALRDPDERGNIPRGDLQAARQAL